MSLWARVYEERRRVIVPLVILAAISVATLLLAVWPLQRSVTNSENAALEAMVGLANARRFERQAREAADSKRRADTELQAFYTDVLPRDFATATKTTTQWLQVAAREAGLEFKASHFDWDVVRDSRLSRAFSTVTLVGKYPNIRRFLYAVETASEFIVIEKVSVAESTGQGSGGNLEVSLGVATYFLSPSGQ
ncbi:MAG: GspMb/PilO family protein [Acidobacteriota bacterium]